MRQKNKKIYLAEGEKTSVYEVNYPTVTRTFAFIDVAGYTSYTRKHGTHAAAAKLHEFRNSVRETVGRYGIRVDKWLGDGVMLVGVKSIPVIHVVSELNKQYSGDFKIHVGLARGKAIIFEGNDYVGDVVNIASRLCDTARPGQILAYNLKGAKAPKNINIERIKAPISIEGAGELSDVITIK